MSLSRADAEALRDAIQDLLCLTSLLLRQPPGAREREVPGARVRLRREEEEEVRAAWRTIERLTTPPVNVPGEDPEAWTQRFRLAAWKVFDYALAPDRKAATAGVPAPPAGLPGRPAGHPRRGRRP